MGTLNPIRVPQRQAPLDSTQAIKNENNKIQNINACTSVKVTSILLIVYTLNSRITLKSSPSNSRAAIGIRGARVICVKSARRNRLIF